MQTITAFMIWDVNSKLLSSKEYYNTLGSCEPDKHTLLPDSKSSTMYFHYQFTLDTTCITPITPYLYVYSVVKFIGHAWGNKSTCFTSWTPCTKTSLFSQVYGNYSCPALFEFGSPITDCLFYFVRCTHYPGISLLAVYFLCIRQVNELNMYTVTV